MCQVAYRVDTHETIGSLGDVRALTPWVSYHPSPGFTAEQVRDEADKIPDDACLCWVNLPSTLVEAGFRVWRNPGVIPEYLCEMVDKEEGE